MNPWSLRCSKLALATVDIHGAVLDCDLWTRRGINFCYCTSHNFIVWPTHRCSRIQCKMAVTLHTDLGDIKLELFCEQVPRACENFLALCASDYYDNCLFHRNIKGFMLQTGDPTGTGKGGQSIWGRRFEDELRDGLKHSVRGVVSMANNGPDTNGSQFFITYAKQPHLDMKYTVFGKVIDGFETLDEFEKIPVHEKNFRPINDVHLQKVTIHANPIAG